MDKVDLKTYLPIIYNGIVEAKTEQDALSIEVNKMNDTYEQALMDQFVQHASLKAIVYYENIFNIVANPVTETLSFRRERVLNRFKMLTPPYTYWYLRSMFDTYFGKGNYILTIDNDNFTITLESSASDSLWYHEIQAGLTYIKPCNMIFINKPRISYNLFTNEQIYKSELIKNYKLDGSWQLGLRPFVSETPEEIYKMPNVASIQQLFIQKNIHDWAELFSKCLINDSISVTNLNFWEETNSLEITYSISKDTVNLITNIKLLDANDGVLINSNVFIPVEDYATIKHVIKLEEGVNV